MVEYIIIYSVVFGLLLLAFNRRGTVKTHSNTEGEMTKNTSDFKEQLLSKDVPELLLFPFLLTLVSEITYVLIFRTLYNNIFLTSSLIIILTVGFLFSKSTNKNEL
jgi:hypothetical protein